MKILTVCGMGFGSSLMLKMTADRVLNKNGIKGEVEACDISTASSMDADLILTNSEFVAQLKGGHAHVAAIKSIISESEVEIAILNFLRNKTNL